MAARDLRAPERRAIMSWMRERPILPRAQWDALDDQARRRAFTVATAAHLNVLRVVWEQADQALAKDLSFDQFELRTMEALAKGWGDDRAPALLAMMESNLQLAYNAGRFVELLLPERLAVRPFLRFDPLLDYRTSQICWHRQGIVRRWDDPFWQRNWPPLHVRCRSSVRALTPGEAQREGSGPPEPPERPQPGGWGRPPVLEEYFPEQRAGAQTTAGLQEVLGTTWRFPPALYTAYHQALAEWRERIPALRQDLRQRGPGGWQGLQEALAWAGAWYPRIQWSLEGAELEQVGPAIIEWHALAQAWPDAALTIWMWGTMPALQEEGPGALSPDRRQLWLSAAWYSSAERWREPTSHLEGWGPGPAITYLFGRLLASWLRFRREALIPVLAPDGFGRVDRVLGLWQRKIRATAGLSQHAMEGPDQALAEGLTALRWWPAARWPPYVRALAQLLDALQGGLETWIPPDGARSMRGLSASEREQARADQLALARKIGLSETDL
jgi:transcriptional regulator with XRE-family HTH domain